MLYTVLLILLVLLLLGALPQWSHMQRLDLGWGPPGVVGLLIIVLLILALTGRA